MSIICLFILSFLCVAGGGGGPQERVLKTAQVKPSQTPASWQSTQFRVLPLLSFVSDTLSAMALDLDSSFSLANLSSCVSVCVCMSVFLIRLWVNKN